MKLRRRNFLFIRNCEWLDEEDIMLMDCWNSSLWSEQCTLFTDKKHQFVKLREEEIKLTVHNLNLNNAALQSSNDYDFCLTVWLGDVSWYFYPISLARSKQLNILWIILSVR